MVGAFAGSASAPAALHVCGTGLGFDSYISCGAH